MALLGAYKSYDNNGFPVRQIVSHSREENTEKLNELPRVTKEPN